MRIGTSLHAIYFKFFDLIDYQKLWMLDFTKDYGLETNEVFAYFYSLCCTFLPNDFDNSFIFYNIKSFCFFQMDRWAECKVATKNFTDTKNAFHIPLGDREDFMVDNVFQMFGRVDCKIREKDKLIICDYKSGYIPISVVEERKNGVYMQGSFPGHYRHEGVFYCILQMLKDGYTFRKELRPDGQKQWFMYHYNERVKDYKNYDWAFIFTNSYMVKRKSAFCARGRASLVTINTVLDKCEEIRSQKSFIRKIDPYTCGNCQFFLPDCSKVMDVALFRDVLRSPDAAQDGVPESEPGDE